MPLLLAVPPSGTPARETAALLKTLDGLEPNAYGCSRGLACLADLDARGLSYALGANAVNRAMSLCANEDAARPEALFHRLAERGLADTASFQIVAASRLSRGALPEAAAATAELLARVERDGRCPAKIAAQCRTVLDACRSAQSAHVAPPADPGSNEQERLAAHCKEEEEHLRRVEPHFLEVLET